MDDELSAEERELLAADDRSEARFGCWASAVAALVLAAGTILLFQALLSMRYGVWPKLSLADGLSFVGIEPGPVDARGAQGVIAWVLQWPLWVVLLVLAVAGILVLTRHDRRPVSDALRTARMKQARRAEPRDPRTG